VALAAWMRNQDYGWLVSLSAAAIIYVVTPFILSQFYAALVLRRMHRKILPYRTLGRYRCLSRPMRSRALILLPDNSEIQPGPARTQKTAERWTEDASLLLCFDSADDVGIQVILALRRLSRSSKRESIR
jgi:hypothetical protein